MKSWVQLIQTNILESQGNRIQTNLRKEMKKDYA